MKKIVFAAGIAALFACPAFAQDANTRPTAESGKKPSEILALVEARPDFARFEEMSWSDNGYYEIEYRTGDKAHVEINIDANGQPVDQK